MHDGGVTIQILVVTLLHPLPRNGSRGVFVDDHVHLLRSMGHDVKVVNPLPKMPQFAEARRSTMMGVAKAPKRWMNAGDEILSPRFFALPEHPYPRLTRWSLRRQAKKVEKQLDGWRPEVIICHTLWPVAEVAQYLATRWKIPWVGVVHGYDFDVALNQQSLSKHVAEFSRGCDALVCASTRLASIASQLEHSDRPVLTIPCLTEIGKEWRRDVKPLSKTWKKEAIDILFPADPRRPEKRHLLALQTGEELERRGWIVGITTLRHQPRDIVFDRMLVADVTLVTSKREAGPLVARESLLCGTPVVSVNVGEVNDYLPKEWVTEATPSALADGIEHALYHGWTDETSVEEKLAFSSREQVTEAWSALLSDLVS